MIKEDEIMPDFGNSFSGLKKDRDRKSVV